MAFRTQKISQMTPKGANLEATDLIEVSTIESGSYVTRSITGQEIIDAAVGNVDWGDIGGTLSNQTDLQNALDAKVPTSRTLTINGVTQDLSANRTFTISTGITIGSTAIASGTVGRILFEGAGNVVQESSSLFWDATNNRLGINTSTPAYDLELRGSRFYHTGKTTTATTTLYNLADNTTANNSYILFGIDTTGGTAGLGISGNYLSAGSDGTGTLRPLIIHHFKDQPIIFANNNAERMRIAATTGNLLINTTTDSGFRLDVNGTARVQGNTSVLLNQNAVTSLTISNNNTGSSAGISSALQSDTSIGNSLLYGSGRINNSVNQYNTGASYIIDYQGPVGLNISSTFASSANSGIRFWTAAGTNNGVERMRIFSSTGNVGINTTTDAGFRLDVNGTARFTGAVTTPAFTMSSNYLGITSGSGGGIYGATLNQSLYIWNRQISTGSGIIIDDFNGVGAANINLNLINIGGGYGTSGTCVHNTLMISRAINMASGTQTVRGFYYNPTLTNTTGLTTHYAIHTAVGRIRFENLPTSPAGLSSGELWNNLGVLMIV